MSFNPRLIYPDFLVGSKKDADKLVAAFKKYYEQHKPKTWFIPPPVSRSIGQVVYDPANSDNLRTALDHPWIFGSS